MFGTKEFIANISDGESLDKKINGFLKKLSSKDGIEVEVIDIKYNLIRHQDDLISSALIIFVLQE